MSMWLPEIAASGLLLPEQTARSTLIAEACVGFPLSPESFLESVLGYVGSQRNFSGSGGSSRDFLEALCPMCP